MADIFLYRPHFVAFIILFLLGIYIMVVNLNLVKKLIGMYLMQTSIILFFITLAVKKDSTIPILLSSKNSSVCTSCKPVSFYSLSPWQ